MKKIILLSLLVLAIDGFSQQQIKQKIAGWHLLDQDADGYMGISLQKAYDLLKGRKSSLVIVAVIDSGIDTLQEDLKSVLWRNEKEINGNGIDDDGNGYVDDIYGWNFCGGKNGENLSRNSHEVARVYHQWKTEFEGKNKKEITEDKKFLYSQWMRAAALINKDYEHAIQQLPQITKFMSAIENASKIICNHLAITEFGPSELKPIQNHVEGVLARSVALWTELFSRANDTTILNSIVLKEVSDFKNDLDNKVNRKINKPEDLRGNLVKDNYLDINDRFYGNNNLKSGSGDHGTLVSGTIAAVRNNGLGIDGIADHVRIMAIRAVPGGDEHDKDVALAIRYAVDNGATIINMSFGKPVSPYKQFVDDAIRYAASKDVLLVHGSGNDGQDIDKEIFYPNPVFIDGTKASNYLTVGASGDQTTGGYAASFSNYSNKWVDLFAPGMYIYATASDNRYVGADGTSLSCPVVSGVAALLRSYFPGLSVEKLIDIMKTSGTTIGTEVHQPGKEDKMVPFSTLSSSGKIINAYKAVQLALSLEQQQKKSF